MHRRLANLISVFTIALGAAILVTPTPALAESGETCCTSANGQAQCCGWHCSATMTTCDACTGFWNCLFT